MASHELRVEPQVSEIPRLLESAVERFGGGPDQAPELDELIALDAEVRAAFAAGPVGAA